MPESNPYQLTTVPRASIEDPFLEQFAAQFGAALDTSAREQSPLRLAIPGEVALDARKDLGLRDREILQEFEQSLVAKGVPIAPAPLSAGMKIALGLLLLLLISKAA